MCLDATTKRAPKTIYVQKLKRQVYNLFQDLWNGFNI